MKSVPLAILLFTLLICKNGMTQDYRGIFVHTEYQFFNYNYYQIGIGFHPKKHLIRISRDNKKYSFIGYTLSYNNHFNNSDWGLAFQTVAYSGSYNGPIGFGMEWNLKSVSKTKKLITFEELSHQDGLYNLCIKSIIGINDIFVEQIAINDFIHSYGSHEDLCRSQGLDIKNLYQKVINLFNKK